MEIQHFFDQATSTLTYVVHDGGTGIVIDPVLDYDPKSARYSFAIMRLVRTLGVATVLAMAGGIVILRRRERR